MTLLLALGVLMNAGLGVFAWIHPAAVDRYL